MHCCVPDDNISEAKLLEILKGYYKLCRKATGKLDLVKDETLIKTLTALMADPRISVSIYIYKILLILTEDPESAKILDNDKELNVQLSNTIFSAQLQPKIMQKLLIVQTRLTNSRSPKQIRTNIVKKEFFVNANKQYVFIIDRPTEIQQRQIEKKCIEIKGVVSVCFQTVDDGVKFVVRCREIESKVIINALLSSGCEMVKQLIKSEDGSTQIFDFYAHAQEMESQETNSSPKYLNDDIEIFDPTQCVITKDQLFNIQSEPGWLSTIKGYFW